MRAHDAATEPQPPIDAERLPTEAVYGSCSCGRAEVRQSEWFSASGGHHGHRIPMAVALRRVPIIDRRYRDRRAATELADGLRLDEAWAEAEAALPEGWGVGVTKTVKVGSGPYVATTDYGPVEHGYAYGPTPAAALRALAARLPAATEPARTRRRAAPSPVPVP